MFSRSFFTLVALVPLALAQSLPTCVETCATTAVQTAGCGSLANTTCICTEQAFLSSAESCVGSSCDATDAATAQEVFQSLCGTTVTPSGSGSATASGSSASATASSPAASSSSTSSGKTTSGAARTTLGGAVILSGLVLGATVLAF